MNKIKITGTAASSGARVIRAPRGKTLSARSWLTEAPLRMLMNNLDPEVAERPGDLVVYGGIGKAARNWECFDAIVATLKRLGADETLAGAVRAAGRCLQHARRRTARAHCQFEPGAALGHLGALQRTRSPWTDDVRPDDRGLVDLHRLAGHRAGHLRDLRRNGPAPFRRLSGRALDTDGGTGRHGWRAAARRDHGGSVDARDRVPPVAHRQAPGDRLPRPAGRLAR